MMAIKIKGKATRHIGGELTPTAVEQLKESMRLEIEDDMQAAIDNELQLTWHVDGRAKTLTGKINIEINREE
jgi:hypothetical protein